MATWWAADVRAPWPTCTTGDCVGVRLPGLRRCLAHAERQHHALALEDIAAGGPIDLRGVPLDERLLGGIIDALPRGSHGPIWERPLFDGATIGAAPAPLDLSGHEFAGATSFRGVRARRAVLLRGAFLENAEFTGAVFDEPLDADGARFRGWARFDEAQFPSGLSLARARFGNGVDLRRTIAGDVGLAGASIGTDIDFSLANFVLLDMRNARVDRDVVFHSATVAEATMAGIETHGHVYGVRARIAGWEPQPQRAVIGERPADWRPDPPPVPEGELPPWRSNLLPDGDSTDYWWVAVEEWVGAGRVREAGGTIGLQLSPWPSADQAGRPVFDEAGVRIATVDADALHSFLASRFGQEHEVRIGAVYAVRVRPSCDEVPEDRKLSVDELEQAVVGVPIDVTRTAREAAQAAAMATVMRPLDPQRDAALITALERETGGQE